MIKVDSLDYFDSETWIIKHNYLFSLIIIPTQKILILSTEKLWNFVTQNYDLYIN